MSKNPTFTAAVLYIVYTRLTTTIFRDYSYVITMLSKLTSFKFLQLIILSAL
jgi:hypothetical protein